MIKKKSVTITKEEHAAEYQRIRHYVISQLLLAGRERKRLASMREMAKMFEVSLTTIQWALRELVEDEYIIAEHGVGLFTNPKKSWVPEPVPIIGVLAADGRQVYYERYLWGLISEVGKHITINEKLLYNINLFYAKNKNAVHYELSQMDGVIWVSPDFAPSDVAEDFVEIADFPVVTIAGKRPGCSSFIFDNYQAGFDVGQIMIEKGVKNPIILTIPESPQLEGLRYAFEKAKIKFNDSLIVYRKQDGAAERFEAFLDAMGIPELIYSTEGAMRDFYHILKKREFDFKKCPIITDENHWKPEFVGWKVIHNFDEIANLAAKQLFAEIDGAAKREVKVNLSFMPVGI